MRPPLRRTVCLAQGEDPTQLVNALIKWFVEDGYKRISVGNPCRMQSSVYVTVSGIQ